MTDGDKAVDGDDLVEVIITAPDEDWLVAFTRRLVNDRLAACGHHTPIRAVYTWDNRVHDELETRVALHTRAGRVQAIIDRTNAEHPYKVACVTATPISDSNPSYRNWIIDNTT